MAMGPNSIKHHPTAYDKVRNILDRCYEDFSITAMQQYSSGVLVQFTQSFTSPVTKRNVTEFRVAYIMFGTANGAPYIQWDNIC